MSVKTLEFSADQQAAVDKILNWIDNPLSDLTMGGLAGTGKALAVDQLIQTSEGPISIGLAKVGQLVAASDGNFYPISGVHPQGLRQTYRVTFRDNTTVDCDAEHLWIVWTSKRRQNKKPPTVMTLKEIMGKGVKMGCGLYRYYIPLPNPVNYEPENPLPLAPYLVGALIGDGALSGSTVTLWVPDDKWEIAERCEAEAPNYVKIKKGSQGYCNYFTFTDPTSYRNRFKKVFGDLGLCVKSPKRRIPFQYLYASVEDRLNLLRGLMDTDGTSRGNRISYSTHSDGLAADVVQLVTSLGGIAIPKKYGGEETQISVKMFECPFHAKVKSQHWKFSDKNPPSRAIINITSGRLVPHVCISVETSPDNSFLTNNHVVTHNSTILSHVWPTLAGAGCAAMTPTGKASQVLFQKGIPATTIHRLIYKFKGLNTRDDGTEDPIFQDEGGWMTQSGDKPGLLACDESSMVTLEQYGDIHARKVPCLWVGDHGQLAPVGGDPGLMRNPKIRLEKIHRQAGDSAIIRLAHEVRKGLQPSKRHADGDQVKVGQITSDRRLIEYAIDNDIDQIIVGTNALRHRLNRLMRNRLHGLTSLDAPPLVDGERLIVTSNDYSYNVFNGQIFRVDDLIESSAGSATCLLSEERIDGWLPRHHHVFPIQLSCLGNPDHRSADRLESLLECDYGYCCTAHKAQGSEWGRVLVVAQDMPWCDMKRWLYTAITRGKNHVSVVMR